MEDRGPAEKHASAVSARFPLEAGRLCAWLTDNISGFAGPIRLERVAGGQSNPTYRLHARSGDYVLRAKPVGHVLPSAHAVDREYRVLDALTLAGVPIPQVRALCRDETVIGSMFYVMDFVPGRVFWDPRLPELARDERGAVFESMNQTIARIHALDPTALGLADFGRAGPYLERQVGRWTKQYRASETEPNPAMDRLIDWLAENLPPDGETRLVHGDYRLDNLLIHPTEPRVVAVLDWELSTLGNPIADFAYHVITWRFPPELFRGLAGIDFEASGIPDEASYVADYMARVGLERPADWEFYIVLSMFRIAAILQGIARRSIDGTASNADADLIGAKARPISELAWSVAQTIDKE